MRHLSLLQWRAGVTYSITRCLQSSSLLNSASTSLLSKLRKSTGFSISKCKNALDKFEGDIIKAEAWLREQAQKEGWAKATKLQDRPMSQGLVGVMVEGRTAAMVEVNCETDFVAKNQKFRSLVSLATEMCMQHGKEQGATDSMIHFDKDTFNGIKFKDQSLVDLVALEVGNIGENIRAKRGMFLQVADGKHLGSYVHNADTKAAKQKCVLGKYGSLVTFSQLATSPEGSLDAALVGNQLALHVVGMNPSEIGEPDPVPEDAEGEPQVEGEKKKKKNKKKKKKANDDESRMIHQQFIGNDRITVGEYVEQNGVVIDGFVRYECGQELPSHVSS